MTLVSGIHHISLKCQNVEEYEEVVNFYQNILEIPVARTWDNGIMFDLGNSLIEVFKNGTDRLNQGVIRHFAFATKDVDGCIAKVKAAGYEITTEPKDIVIKSVPELPARIAFCKGPLGEEIEFFHEK